MAKIQIPLDQDLIPKIAITGLSKTGSVSVLLLEGFGFIKPGIF